MSAGVPAKRYYEEINIARGIAVTLVMIGHSFPRVSASNNPGTAENFLVNFIYYFHMALFMFLSGFVASRKVYSPGTNVGAEVIKNAKRLLVPYLLFSAVSFVLKQIFGEYANRPFGISDLWKILLGQNPNGGLWYLWTLFVLSACVLLLSRLVRRDIVFLLLGLLLQILFFVLPLNFLGPLFRMGIFYLAGMVTARYYDGASAAYTAFIRGRPVTLLLPAAALAVIGAVTWLTIGSGVQTQLYPFTAFLGIYACLDLSLRIAVKKGAGARLFGVLGDYSYDLYLLSYFVQVPIRVIGYSMLGLPYAAVVLSMLILGTLIPYIASRFVIRRFRLLSGIVLGKWD